MTIQTRLTLSLGAVALLPLLVVSAIFYWLLTTTLVDYSLLQLTSIASIQEDRVTSWLRRTSQQLDRIEARPGFAAAAANAAALEADGARAVIDDILLTVVAADPQVRAVSLINDSADIIASAGDPSAAALAAAAAPDMPRASVVRTEADEVRLVRVGDPLAGGAGNAHLLLEVSAAELDAITTDYAGLGASGETLVAGRQADGSALFLTALRFDSTAGLQKTLQEGVNVPMSHALQRNEGTLTESVDYRGVRVLAATRYVEDFDWGVVVKQDVAEALAPARRLSWLIVSILAVASVSAGLIAVTVARAMARPIRELAATAERISSGELSLRARAGGSRELAALSGSFNRMVDHVIEAAESDRQQFFVLSLDLVCVAGFDGYFQDLNPAWEATLGWTVDELKATPFIEFVHPDDREATLAEIADVGRGHDLLAFENRYRCKDGTYRWLAWSAAASVKHGKMFSVARDISESRQREEALRRARDEADRAARLKAEFLANMSHEIRTPMNAVIGMTSLLLDTELDSEQLEYINTVRASGDHLLTIINDILDMSKIEADMLHLEQAPFSMPRVIEEALDLVGPAAAAKKLELAYLESDDFPTGYLGDAGRVRQILVNLLSNGVKFTDTGTVLVTARADAPEGSRRNVHIEVRDTGCGIDEEGLARIFRPFEQVDPSATRRQGGTGLGLSISRRLCALMGGTLWAESESGTGSVFHVEIPLEETSVPASPSHDDINFEGLPVLVVDDNEINRQILVKFTERWGMVPTATEDGPGALETFGSGDYAVILLDHDMPGMDGIEVARKIRSEPGGDSIPIVLITSIGRRAGADAADVISRTIAKPLKPSVLFDTLVGMLYTPTAEAAVEPHAQPVFNVEIGRASPLRILVAEDNRLNQIVIERQLAKFGYRADIANTGVEAVAAVENNDYDVVFMDVQMPEMDGLEATRQITGDDSGERPLIFAMTAHVGSEFEQVCAEAGMDGFIGKPVDVVELERALRVAARRDGEPARAGGEGSANE